MEFQTKLLPLANGVLRYNRPSEGIVYALQELQCKDNVPASPCRRLKTPCQCLKSQKLLLMLLPAAMQEYYEHHPQGGELDCGGEECIRVPAQGAV